MMKHLFETTARIVSNGHCPLFLDPKRIESIREVMIGDEPQCQVTMFSGAQHCLPFRPSVLVEDLKATYPRK